MRVLIFCVAIILSGCSEDNELFEPGAGGEKEEQFYSQLEARADAGDADQGATLVQLKYWSQAETRADSLEAIEMYKRYAEEGSAGAAAHLVRIYLQGQAVSPDTLEAAKWLEVGAKNGSPEMQRSLDIWNRREREATK